MDFISNTPFELVAIQGGFQVIQNFQALDWQVLATKQLQERFGTVFTMLSKPRRVGKTTWIEFLCRAKLALQTSSNMESLNNLGVRPNTLAVFIPWHSDMDLLAIGEYAQEKNVNLVITDCGSPIPLARKIETCSREEFDVWMEIFKASKP